LLDGLCFNPLPTSLRGSSLPKYQQFILRLDSDAGKAEYRLMQTLSPTKARSNLTFWLKAAACGQDVGILYGDQIIALRPVSVESTDYAFREYGASNADVDRFSQKAHEEIQENRRAATLKSFTGNLEDLLADQVD
jgi:hypothetical protein